MRPRLLCSILALTVLVGACGGDDDDVAASNDDSDSTATTDTTGTTEMTTPAGENPLAGRTFRSESVTENGQPRALVEDSHIELAFTTDGRITAQAGCNHLGGPVTVEPERLVVGELTSTLMGCSPELQAQDDWLSAVLTSNPTFRLDGDRLSLEGNGSVIELVDTATAEPARPLVGTVWQVDSLIDGDTVSSASSGATVQFTEDGRIDVHVCNQGSASATVGETDIEVGPLAMTRMACEPDVMDTENAVVAVLDGTVAYEIEGATLTLTHPSGKALTLQAQ